MCVVLHVESSLPDTISCMIISGVMIPKLVEPSPKIDLGALVSLGPSVGLWRTNMQGMVPVDLFSGFALLILLLL